MPRSTISQQPERRMTGAISCACPGDAYRALSEHAYVRRQSVGSLVREALEAAGLFEMPDDDSASVKFDSSATGDAVGSEQFNDDGVLDALAD